MTEPSATVININASSSYNHNTLEWRKDTSQTISGSEVFYERYISDVLDSSGASGFSIKLNSDGTTSLRAESDNNTGTPKTFSTDNINFSTNVDVVAGNTVYGRSSGGSTVFNFTVLGTHLWTASSGGPGTLSTADTASFAGTTPQQIQWAITNGQSPVANTNYYLFNETPGGNALDTINLGSNPQVGSTSTETYINPSGADFTGKWYIGYGQNSTRVNLKVYDFSSRKVFCNFW